MMKKLIFLGTGGSVGVPLIGCLCDVCKSSDLKNKRLRPSVLLCIGEKRYLIDAGPDFRQQALRAGITQIDGVLLTHAHHDHTAGMDDLRPLYFLRQSPLPVLLSAATAQDIKNRYHYLFASEGKKTVSHFDLQIIEEGSGTTTFEGLTVQFTTYKQGGMLVNGFRFGNFAYLSDIREYSPAIFDELFDVKYLVISALRYTPSPLHLSVDEAVDFSRRIKAERVWLTHISHELEHQKANAYLPQHIRLAYDGLEIALD